MDKRFLCFHVLTLFFAVGESQRWPTQGRCPPPTGPGVCASNCQPGRLSSVGGTWGACPRGQLCCRNGCGAYVCTNVRPGPPPPPPSTGVPPWCPPGSPRIRCFVNPCTILTCPRFPSARCLPTNPCEPACTGAYFYRGRQIPDYMCRGERPPRRG